jgi:hypothetical protein
MTENEVTLKQRVEQLEQRMEAYEQLLNHLHNDLTKHDHLHGAVFVRRE